MLSVATHSAQLPATESKLLFTLNVGKYFIISKLNVILTRKVTYPKEKKNFFFSSNCFSLHNI